MQQIYTGFAMLRRRGLIHLTQQVSNDAPRHSKCDHHLRRAAEAHVRVVVNERTSLHYDNHDSIEIEPQHLDQCDLYFKRSYSNEYVRNLPRHAQKVRPLGLNYQVLADFVDLFALGRGWRLAPGMRRKLGALREALDAHNVLKFSARTRDIESLPEPVDEPRVIFQVVAHDPHDDSRRTADSVSDRIATNESKAACIRALREAFGNRFQGGFIPNRTARKHYADLLVPESHAATKQHYLQAVRRHPICVASTGLHGSTGWKFAEYVALSRAIVSETPKFTVPWAFREGQNYLQFSSPDECVSQCQRLADDPALRRSLMVNNARYYQSHLRPDALVMNTLLMAIHMGSSLFFDGFRSPHARCRTSKAGEMD